MDVGTRLDGKAGPPATGAGVRETPTASGDAEGAKDPSQRAQDTATHNEQEVSSSEKTGAKDAAEQETQTRDETRKPAVAA